MARNMFLFCALFFIGCSSQESVDVDVRESDFILLLKSTPKKFGDWRLLPEVVICQNAPISEKQIMNAVDFWRSLGYRFGVISSKYSESCFTHGRPYYHITIEMNNRAVDEMHCGETALYLQGESHEILGARIYLRSGDGNSPGVIEHEFGHALGWKHFRKNGHLMHPALRNGGFDTQGLKNNIVPVVGYGIASDVNESDMIQVCSDRREK